jgi:hypothetical protein
MNGRADAAVYRRQKIIAFTSASAGRRTEPIGQLALTLEMKVSTSRFKVSACADRCRVACILRHPSRFG